MSKPTPAPWIMGRQLGGSICLSPDTTRGPASGHNGSQQIAVFYGPDAAANAELCAKAGLMWDLLVEVADFLRHGSPVHPGSDVARDVLALVGDATHLGDDPLGDWHGRNE